MNALLMPMLLHHHDTDSFHFLTRFFFFEKMLTQNNCQCFLYFFAFHYHKDGSGYQSWAGIHHCPYRCRSLLSTHRTTKALLILMCVKSCTSLPAECSNLYKQTPLVLALSCIMSWHNAKLKLISGSSDFGTQIQISHDTWGLPTMYHPWQECRTTAD